MKRYSKPKKNLLFLLLNSFERWYYNLPFVVRHVVGVLLVVFFLGGLFGLCYGGYKTVTIGYNWVLTITQGTWHLHDHGDDFSGKGYSHFDFPLSDKEKHPKRMPNYSQDFGYVNDVHLQAAIRLGIEPQETREDLERMADRLVQLHDTRYYEVLPLTSSSPYLVPRAADFLTALGRLLQEYNGTSSRFYISSVLRTQQDVRQLGRVNRNASQNSTHCYGTTVDITYSRFDVHDRTTEQQLKLDLARALYDLQTKGYCYVKYEYKQPCFHITVRP